MASSFSELLTGLLKAKNLSPHVFATRIDMRPTTYIYAVLNARRPPQPKYIERMADVLELSEAERYRFYLQAAFPHLPSDLRTLLYDSQRRLGLLPTDQRAWAAEAAVPATTVEDITLAGSSRPRTVKAAVTRRKKSES